MLQTTQHSRRPSRVLVNYPNSRRTLWYHVVLKPERFGTMSTINIIILVVYVQATESQARMCVTIAEDCLRQIYVISVVIFGNVQTVTDAYKITTTIAQKIFVR